MRDIVDGQEGNKTRWRIAPSPTGDPHVGFAFTALFNYLCARKYGGKLVFRLEDTDRVRFKADSERKLLESLRWLGIECDEGGGKDGEYAPYQQSERLHIYRRYLDELLAKKCVYRCFCTKERLAQIREEQRARKEIPKYDRHCRELAEDEITRNLGAQTPFVIRLKMPMEGETSFRDEIRGEITIANTQLDDQVLRKSDGYPTYHLASVVDDIEMKITHVVRAEEWLSSTPKHIVLYEALGCEVPRFLHLPILRNVDHTKISKRKNPVSLRLFARLGILPQALLNYLGMIGGSIDLAEEVYDIEQMVAHFSPLKLNLGDPIFDMQKLLWLNQRHIMRMDKDEFVAHLQKNMVNTENLQAMYPLLRSRLTHFAEFFAKTGFFWEGKLSYEGLSIIPKTKTKDEFLQILTALVEKLEDDEMWTHEHIKGELQRAVKDAGWKTKELFMPLRLILTATSASPELIPTMEVLGKELVTYRLRDFLQQQTKVSNNG